MRFTTPCGFAKHALASPWRCRTNKHFNAKPISPAIEETNHQKGIMIFIQFLTKSMLYQLKLNDTICISTMQSQRNGEETFNDDFSPCLQKVCFSGNSTGCWIIYPCVLRSTAMIKPSQNHRKSISKIPRVSIPI